VKGVFRFTDLSIRRAPGFPSGMPTFSSFGGGLTVVLGSNAAGKTSTAGALVKTLTAPDFDDPRWSLSGGFTLNDAVYRFDLDAGRFRVFLGSDETAFPIRISKEHTKHLSFGLKSLLESKGKGFAQAVRKEALGGYDPALALEKLQYKSSRPNKNTKEYKDLQRTEAEIQKLRGEENTFLSQKSRLAALEEQRSALHKSAKLLEPLRHYLAYLDAKARHEAALAGLEDFSDNVSKLNGREAEDVKTLEEHLQREKNAAETAEGEIEPALETLRGNDLGELKEDPSPDIMRRLDALQKADDEETRLQGELDAALAKRREIMLRAGLKEDDEGAKLKPKHFGELENILHELEKARASFLTADAERRYLLDLPEGSVDAETALEGMRRLARWLAEAEDFSITEGELRPYLYAGIALSIAGILGALFLHPLFGIAAALAAAVPYLAFLKKPAVLPRELRRKDFISLGLTEPEAWNDEAVARHLSVLLQAGVEARMRKEQSLKAEDLERRLAELKDALQKIEARRDKASEYLGLSIKDSSQLLLFAGTAVELSSNFAREAQISEALAAGHARRRQALDAFNAVLGRYSRITVETAEEAADAAHDFAKRASLHLLAAGKLEHAKARLRDAESRLGDLQRKRAELYEKAGLAVGDRQGLAELLDERISFRKALDESEAAGRDEMRLERIVSDFTELDEATRALSRDELEHMLRSAEQAAREENTLAEEIGGLRRELELAREHRDLEDLLAQRSDAMRKLKDVRAAHCLAELGALLGRYLEESDRENVTTGIFNRAEALFAEFTNDRYRLIFNRGEPGFSAEDHDTGRLPALDELSDGTRLQLLFALRIAYIENAEHEVALPLFLDETLANSDPERSRAVIDAVQHISKRGRQVFYFTARPEEAGYWKEALNDSAGGVMESETPPTVFINLDALWRNEDAPMAPAEYKGEQEQEPAAPKGKDHAAYGELLGVPGISVDAAPESAHIWHFINDVDTLHQLLLIRHDSLGRLKSLLQRGAPPFLAQNAPLLKRLYALENVLRSVIPLARRGRGMAVDREVLLESNIVSPRFLDETAALAEQLGFDAARLIRALRNKEVKNFRRDAVERLAEHLEERGYLDERPKAEHDELVQRGMQEAAGDISDGVLKAADVEALVQRIRY
jgi:uncharacterized protein YhaN